MYNLSVSMHGIMLQKLYINGTLITNITVRHIAECSQKLISLGMIGCNVDFYGLQFLGCHSCACRLTLRDLHLSTSLRMDYKFYNIPASPSHAYMTPIVRVSTQSYSSSSDETQSRHDIISQRPLAGTPTVDINMVSRDSYSDTHENDLQPDEIHEDESTIREINEAPICEDYGDSLESLQKPTAAFIVCSGQLLDLEKILFRSNNGHLRSPQDCSCKIYLKDSSYN
jgi:hypothetical protein